MTTNTKPAETGMLPLRDLALEFFRQRLSIRLDVAKALGFDGRADGLEGGRAFLAHVRDTGRLAELQSALAITRASTEA